MYQQPKGISTEDRNSSPDEYQEKKMEDTLLWRAIFDNYQSVSAFCRQNPALREAQVGNLLRFKESPFRANGTYKKICYALEQTTRIAVEVLFDEEMYNKPADPNKTIEISSFTDLAEEAQKEMQSKPAILENSVEVTKKTEDIEGDIHKALQLASYREREIIKARFGLGERGKKAQTLEEVAEIFRIHKERVRQIEARGIRRLQNKSDVLILLSKYVHTKEEDENE